MATTNKYGTLSLDALDEVSKQVAALSSNQFMTLEPGDNLLRFLPARTPGVSPLRVTSLHYVNNVPGLDKVAVFACPAQERQVPCPVCLRAMELKRSPIPAEIETGKKMEANLKVFANVLNRSAPGAGPVIFGFGRQVYSRLQALRKNRHTGGDFTDPTARGFDVVITKSGTGLTTNYEVTAVRELSPLADTEEQIDALIEASHDLEEQAMSTIPDAVLAMVAPMRAFNASATQVAGRGQVGAGFARQPAAAISAAAKPAPKTAIDFSDE